MMSINQTHPPLNILPEYTPRIIFHPPDGLAPPPSVPGTGLTYGEYVPAELVNIIERFVLQAPNQRATRHKTHPRHVSSAVPPRQFSGQAARKTLDSFHGSRSSTRVGARRAPPPQAPSSGSGRYCSPRLPTHSNPVLSPRFLNEWHPMTWQAILADLARHVIQCIMSPRFLH